LLLLAALVAAGPAGGSATVRLLLTADLGARSRPSADFSSPGQPRRLLGGWAGLERAVDSLRTDRCLYLDCGGFGFGSLEGNASSGRAGVELLNALGCDAATLGAREFSAGQNNVEALALAAHFPLLSDPMLDVALRRRAPLFRPYAVFDCRGVRVAVTGLLDPRVNALNAPDDVPGIAAEPALVQCRRFLAAVERESADITVVIGRISAADARLIADSLPAVDVVVAAAGGDEPMRLGRGAVVGAGRLGQRIGVADVTVDRADRAVLSVEYRLVNVEPRPAAGAEVTRLLARADSLAGLDTAGCVVPVEFGADTAGRLGLGATACRELAALNKADIVVLPWSALGSGLAAGPAGRRELADALPFGEQLCLVGLDDTALARLVTPDPLDTVTPAPLAWGLDYYVNGDTTRWPGACEVLRPRVRRRKLALYRVLTTRALYARSALGFDARGLPGNLTLDWVGRAASLDTLRPEPPPRRLEAAPGLARRELTGGLVNINTADSAALCTLPGVGPKTAQRIIQYRAEAGRFGSVDELLNVRGIGPKRLEQLRSLVTVR
jgi:competence ComEA-like helix-hairpin-helix protein